MNILMTAAVEEEVNPKLKNSPILEKLPPYGTPADGHIVSRRTCFYNDEQYDVGGSIYTPRGSFISTYWGWVKSTE